MSSRISPALGFNWSAGSSVVMAVPEARGIRKICCASSARAGPVELVEPGKALVWLNPDSTRRAAPTSRHHLAHFHILEPKKPRSIPTVLRSKFYLIVCTT
jgi:hypothetical protein